MGELTPEAKAEIAAAIAIVREDRFEKFARERVAKHTERPADPPPTPPGPTPPTLPTPPGPTPPPPKPTDPPTPPPTDPPVERSRYWGEILR